MSELGTERFACTCKPGDGTESCPREDQCFAEWLDRGSAPRFENQAEELDEAGGVWHER